MTLKVFWPQLFDGNSPRLLATGMREQLFADIASAICRCRINR
jgi:hypothetical protein